MSIYSALMPQSHSFHMRYRIQFRRSLEAVKLDKFREISQDLVGHLDWYRLLIKNVLKSVIAKTTSVIISLLNQNY